MESGEDKSLHGKSEGSKLDGYEVTDMNTDIGGIGTYQELPIIRQATRMLNSLHLLSPRLPDHTVVNVYSLSAPHFAIPLHHSFYVEPLLLIDWLRNLRSIQVRD